ncbi:hypothetical protein Desor_1889 [Desulfosporosinus orientis DSM 765]|uniref:Uncharacterized protein n=1 Tax=Desulfosporosinus orientis (strain ATCC 19365 / DSM 765 / NCIMB 8382 / VKM B-1628 / Singapore I) TaxID=768706 RepID=G7WB19_DESOD|nr:hypothetical protein [Desulfosporosinus orientis]AET67520.1 hypothetical protein Desor_1889 [Desulfosporosinus orientis DSM 765]
MEKNSYSPNCIIPGSEFKLSKEPLNFGISIFDPVSSVDGSPTFFFLQPLLAGKVFTSVLIIIISQIILFIFNRFWDYNLPPSNKRLVFSPEQTVSMSLSDLQNFLASMAGSKSQSSANQPSSNQPPSGQTSPDQPPPAGQEEGGITPETREIPLILALAVWGDFQNKAYSPSVFLLFPILVFPGVRGALPILILELLTTIFVRAVVPPETTGAKPLKAPTPDQTTNFEGFY